MFIIFTKLWKKYCVHLTSCQQCFLSMHCSQEKLVFCVIHPSHVMLCCECVMLALLELLTMLREHRINTQYERGTVVENPMMPNV